MRAALAGTVLLALALASPRARAGGFEFPDNGAEALGRGAAFTAKADDGTALMYNIAGFARQRGTRLYVGGNLTIQDYEFLRAGTYPDNPSDPATPWGGEPFPKVRNTAGPFFAPMAALSTDFGVFDRLTFAIGVYGPSTIGNRTFPLGVAAPGGRGGFPAPSRYDFVQSRSLIIFPTAALAYRLTPWLDVGVGAAYVLGTFDQTSVSFTDLGRGTAQSPGPCPNLEYSRCDSLSVLRTSASAPAGTFGVLLRPSASFALGANARMPVSFTADGQITPTPPKVAPIDTPPGPARLQIALPWYFRFGARYIVMDKTFEVADVEVDATYETWGTAQAAGPRASVPELGPLKDITTTILHHYDDTFSVRAGGAYNLRELEGVVSLRAGGYFDASATAAPYTRLDFDTLSKIAGTVGVGYKISGIAFNLGYAFIFSLPRKVTNGLIRPNNPQQKGDTLDADGNALPPVNNGNYSGSTHLVSLGLSVVLDELFGYGKARKVEALNDYEGPPFGVAGAPAAEKPAGEAADGEPTDANEKDAPKKKVDPDEAAERALAGPKRAPPPSEPTPVPTAEPAPDPAPAPAPAPKKPAKKPVRKKPKAPKKATDMEL